MDVVGDVDVIDVTLRASGRWQPRWAQLHLTLPSEETRILRVNGQKADRFAVPAIPGT
nr:hypothetical protein [Paracoccus saliphilus]